MGDGGKGSRPRPFSVSQETFANNYDNIFKKDKTVQVKVQEDSSEIGKCGCGRSPTGKCIGWHGLTEEGFKEALEKYKTNQEDTAGSSV
jgi:endonuclease I